MLIQNATRTLVVLVAALTATGASAFEFHGYFRDSAAFNSKGGGQVCFQLPGSDFKARLGNECERYLEMEFSEKGKLNSVDWQVVFMPASAMSTSSADTNSLFLQQMWAGLKFNDWDGITLWAGRRYWKRHDVHSIDWFYWNPAQGNAAAGVEDVKLGGFGKAAVTVIKIDATTNPALGTYLVPDIRAYDIPLNTDGTLEVGLDFGLATDQNHFLGATRALGSPLFTVQHNQANIFGGSNTLAFQYGTGAFSKESGDGPGQLLSGGTIDNKQWRIIEHLVVNPVPEFSGALVLVYQNKSAPSVGLTNASIISAEVRPAYHFSDYFKFALDVFYQRLMFKDAPAGTSDLELIKVTAAPTFVLGRGYYARPELRFFVTYGSWNDAAAAAGTMASGAFGTDKNGFSMGANIEMWF